MKPHVMTIVLFVLAAAIVGGLLYRDGAFLPTITITAPAVGASAQLSDFGPPTRLMVDTDPSGVRRRKVLAEPVYTDVRIPSFFDQIDVRLVLWDAMSVAKDIKVGFELGRDTGQYAFGETRVEAVRALGGRVPSVIHAQLSLAGVPQEDNRFRLVVSMPGVDPEHPVLIDHFSVTAHRSGNWKFLLSRFFHF